MPNKLFKGQPQDSQESQDPGWLWKLAALATRIGSGTGASLVSTGLATAPVGAAIGGAGESAAEWMEGSKQDPVRIGTEAALGAIPLGKVLKAARPAVGALKGVLHSEGSNLIRRKETEGHFLPTTLGEAGWDALATATGGLAGYGVSKAPRISGEKPAVSPKFGSIVDASISHNPVPNSGEPHIPATVPNLTKVPRKGVPTEASFPKEGAKPAPVREAEARARTATLPKISPIRDIDSRVEDAASIGQAQRKFNQVTWNKQAQDASNAERAHGIAIKDAQTSNKAEAKPLQDLLGEIEKGKAARAKSTEKGWQQEAKNLTLKDKYAEGEAKAIEKGISQEDAQHAKNLNTQQKFRRSVEVARANADTQGEKATQAGWTQEARNLNTGEKKLAQVAKTTDKETSDILRNRQDADKATVRQLIADQKGRNALNSTLRKDVEDQAKLAQQLEAESKISGAKEGKLPVTGDPRQTFRAGNESVTKTWREPPPPPDEPPPPPVPRGPKFGDTFQTEAEAQAAATKIEGASVKPAVKGFKVVPKKLVDKPTPDWKSVPKQQVSRGSVDADVDAITRAEDATQRMGIQRPPESEPPNTAPAVPTKPKGPQGPTQGSGRAPWKPVPPRTAKTVRNSIPETANNEEAIFNGLASDAMKQGYQGSHEDLRTAFNEKMKDAHDLHDTMVGSDLDNDPTNLLRKIVSYGGVKSSDGEFTRLWDNATKGTIRGVRGVIKQNGSGKTADEIIHRLSQDPQFAHIQYPRDLAEALEKAGQAPHETATLEKAAEGAGLKRGTKWWEPPTQADEFNPGDLEGGAQPSQAEKFQDFISNDTPEEAAKWNGVERRAADFTKRIHGDRAGDLKVGKDELLQNFLKEQAGFKPEAKTPLTYEQFAKAYGDAFNSSMKYHPNLAGSQHFTDEMAKLADAYPEYLAKLEGASAEPAIPGLEGVRQVENPTPQVAEAPYSLTQEAAQTQGVTGDLLSSSALAPEKAAELPKGAIPARDILKTPREVSWKHYEGLQAEGKELPGVDRKNQPARLAGRAAQRIAKTEAQGTASQGATAQGLSEDLANLEKLSPADRASAIERMKREGGEISPLMLQLLTRGSGAALGAATGAALNDDDPWTGGILGGLAGAAAPSFLPRSMGGGFGSDAETVGETINGMLKRLPNWQRSSMLYDPRSMAINSIAGPYGAGIMGGLEEWGSGNPAGKELLREMRPDKWARRYKDAWKEAQLMLDENEINRADFSHVPEKTGLDTYMEVPARNMLAGDVATRNTGMGVGIPEERMREIGLTNEPRDGTLGKNTVDFGKSTDEFGNSSIPAQLILPFKRTVANIVASSADRTPIVGELVNWYRSMNGIPQLTGQERLTRQGLGTAVIGGALGLGYLVPPEVNKTLKIQSLISNLGGQYGLLAGAAYAAGQAMQAGKMPASTILNNLQNTVPLPAFDVLGDLAKPPLKLLTGEPLTVKDIPSTLVPKFIPMGINMVKGLSEAAQPSLQAPTQSRSPEDIMRSIRARRGQQ